MKIHKRVVAYFLSPRQANISQRLGIIMPLIMQTASEANETNPFNKLFQSFKAFRVCAPFEIIKQISHFLLLICLSYPMMLMEGGGRGDLEVLMEACRQLLSVAFIFAL